jgi:hypothetical protein
MYRLFGANVRITEKQETDQFVFSMYYVCLIR